jgi:nitroreductase
MNATHWEHFRAINSQRRSIRDFTDEQVSDEDIKDILNEALLAPSSANSQPYEIHWIKDPVIKEQVAKACNNQRAARSAKTLFVLVAGTHIVKKSIDDHADYIETSTLLSEKSQSFNRKTFTALRRFLKIAPLVIWTPLLTLFSNLLPALSLMPFGGIGFRQWAARNSIYAAQNLMLAAVAKGYDTCPMEGFNAQKIASILRLPYGATIPLVIAFGKKREDAIVDPQWRRPLASAMKQY